MKKLILFLVLSILFLALFALIFNAYQLQKDYFDNKNKVQEKNNTVQIEEGLGTPSFYKDYSKEDYDLALNYKRVLVLYFTSNWCEECLNQDMQNFEVFTELNKEGVIGLKIHILDSETTQETDALAKKFDVTKEQSFVILDKAGAVALKYTGILPKDTLRQEILELR